MGKFIYLFFEGTIVFVLIWAFNYFFFVRKRRKLDKDDMPLELIYLSAVCNIDPYRVNFKRFQMAYCFINAFIITTDYLLVVYLIKSMFLKIIVGIVLVILLIIVCYGLLGRYYQRKQSYVRKKD